MLASGTRPAAIRMEDCLQLLVSGPEICTLPAQSVAEFCPPPAGRFFATPGRVRRSTISQSERGQTRGLAGQRRAEFYGVRVTLASRQFTARIMGNLPSMLRQRPSGS